MGNGNCTMNTIIMILNEQDRKFVYLDPLETGEMTAEQLRVLDAQVAVTEGLEKGHRSRARLRRSLALFMQPEPVEPERVKLRERIMNLTRGDVLLIGNYLQHRVRPFTEDEKGTTRVALGLMAVHK